MVVGRRNRPAPRRLSRSKKCALTWPATPQHCAKPVSLEALPLDALYGDLEQLEQRLTAIEEKMIGRLRSDASDEALFEARRALDRELQPYRGKMSAEQLSMLEKQFLERKLLENTGLPRLSLFYLYS